MAANDVSLKDVLTEETLLELAGSRSFERGQDYYNDGQVVSLVQDREIISAVVEGTTNYRVKLWVHGSVLDYSCSCPVGERGDFCKHCVAAGLEWLAEMEEAGEESTPYLKRQKTTMEDVRTYLEGRSKAELIDMVVKQAMDDERLRDSLLLRVASATPAGVDIAAFRKAIDKALKPEYPSYDHYYDYDEETRLDEDALDHVVETIRAILDDGHPEAVIDLAEYAFDKIAGYTEEEDYYDNDVDVAVGKFEDLHHDAYMQIQMDPCELAEKLFYRELNDEYGFIGGTVGNYADVLGEEGMAHFRQLAEAEWERAVAEGDTDRGSPARYLMEDVALHYGDIDTVVSIKSSDLTSSRDYLEIADIYKREGNLDLAIDWAERGLGEPTGFYPSGIQQFLIAAYREAGRYVDALEIVWDIFSKHSTLDRYKELKDNADPLGEWPQWRERALNLIRQENQVREQGVVARSPFDTERTLLVDIFLWEDDLDSALREAKEGGCTASMWQMLAARLEEPQPEEALNIYQMLIEPTIEETNNAAYEQVVRFLHKVNRIMNRLGRGDEFVEYVAALRKEYFRKRNFISLLNAAKWV